MVVLLTLGEGQATVFSAPCLSSPKGYARCSPDLHLLNPSDWSHILCVASGPSVSYLAKRQEPAPGILLVASRELSDPNFLKTVVLLIEHNSLGTMGIVLNRPTNVPVSAALPQLQALAGNSSVIRVGGPVAIETISSLVKTTIKLDYARAVLTNVYFINTMDALSQVLTTKHPEMTLYFFAGYAGWAPGQLEFELLNGSWYLVEVDPEFIFNRDPGTIWPELIEYVTGQWVRNNLTPLYSIVPCSFGSVTYRLHLDSVALGKLPSATIFIPP